MKKYFFLAAAAAMMLSACSDNYDSVDEGPVPLTLSVTNTVGIPEITTRSNENNIQATTLDPTSTAATGLFILKRLGKDNASLSSYEKWNLASTGYIANTTVITNTNIKTSSTLYYPDDKTQNLDIYAYTPHDDYYAGTDISTTAVTVKIKGNQSTKANYLLSDVLWGCVGDGTNGGTTSAAGTETATNNKSNSPINAANHKASKATATNGYVTGTQEVIIPMFHKAAKIVIKITPTGMDVSMLKGATVNFYVNGTQDPTNPGVDPDVPILSTSLNVYTGAITALTPATPTHYIAPIKFTDKLGKNESGSDIAVDTDVTEAAKGTNGVISSNGTDVDGYACSGIILPQTVTEGEKLIEITLANGTTYEYVIPTTGSPVIKFDSGKVYTYSISLTASTLSLTTTVANWVDATSGTPIPGSAVLQ